MVTDVGVYLEVGLEREGSQSSSCCGLIKTATEVTAAHRPLFSPADDITEGEHLWGPQWCSPASERKVNISDNLG